MYSSRFSLWYLQLIKVALIIIKQCDTHYTDLWFFQYWIDTQCLGNFVRYFKNAHIFSVKKPKYFTHWLVSKKKLVKFIYADWGQYNKTMTNFWQPKTQKPTKFNLNFMNECLKQIRKYKVNYLYTKSTCYLKKIRRC